jgi:dolichol-phosphate mannosyltransferase
MDSRLLTDYFQRVSSLNESDLWIRTRARFDIEGLLVAWIDLSLFLSVVSLGMTPGTGHVLSFASAAVFNYILNGSRSVAGGERGQAIKPSRVQFLPFLNVLLIVLFLRGGVLVTLIELLGWRPQVAILPAIGVTAILNQLGNHFLVIPLWEKGLDRKSAWQVLALGVVGYTLLLRLFYLGTANLLPQEAYYWNYAQHLDIGYLDHPPMIAWVIWLGTFLFGDTEFAIRLGAFSSWLVTAFFSFRLTCHLFDESVAFRVLLLLAILPFFFGVGFVMTPDGLLLACWAGMLYFLERALLAERRLAWWGVGVWAGLGMLSKYTIVLLGPPLLLFMLMDHRSRRWLLQPEPYVAVLVALLLFMPVIVWNSEHQWASFIFQGPRRFQEPLSFSLPHLVGSVLLLLTPTGALAAFAAILAKRRTRAEVEGFGKGIGERGRLFAALFTFIPFLFFFAYSLAWEAKLNWTGPIWLAVLPLVAWQMTPSEALRPTRMLRFLQRVWPPTIVATMLFLGVFLHFWVLGLPGISYPQGKNVVPLIGWKELSQAIARVEEKVETSTGTKPLVVGMDKSHIASELAFYRHKLSHGEKTNQAVFYTTGRHLFGMESLMYRYWFPDRVIKRWQGENQNLILVTHELPELMNDRIKSSGWKIGKVKDLELRKNGILVGHYYYTLATHHPVNQLSSAH